MRKVRDNWGGVGTDGNSEGCALHQPSTLAFHLIQTWRYNNLFNLFHTDQKFDTLFQTRQTEELKKSTQFYAQMHAHCSVVRTKMALKRATYLAELIDGSSIPFSLAHDVLQIITIVVGLDFLIVVSTHTETPELNGTEYFSVPVTKSRDSYCTIDRSCWFLWNIFERKLHLTMICLEYVRRIKPRQSNKHIIFL